MTTETKWYGISCWQSEARGGCNNSFNIEYDGTVEDSNRVYKLAADAGWVIGHYDGQGHYACPECRNTLYNPAPMS